MSRSYSGTSMTLDFNYTKKNKITDEAIIWLESNGFDCIRPQSGMVTIYAKRGGTLLAVVVKPGYKKSLPNVQKYLEQVVKVAKCKVILVANYDEFVHRVKQYAQRRTERTKTTTINGRKYVTITKGKVSK